MGSGNPSDGQDDALAFLAAWWGVTPDEVVRMTEGVTDIPPAGIRKIERDLLDALARVGFLRITRQADGSDRIEVVPDAPAMVVRWSVVPEEEAQQ